MTHRTPVKFLFVLAWLSVSGALRLPAAELAPARPNVLFLLIDDHAANMTSVGHESPVRTPNIERLAARGSWFTRAYAAVPSCAPSRP